MDDTYPEMSLFPIQLRIAFHKQNITQLRCSIARLKTNIDWLKMIVYRCSTPMLVEVTSDYSWSSSDSNEDFSMGLFD